jgi:prepilin-type N-terminal cleavage/methylation domain-containing protein
MKAFKDENGLTLVEVLAALVILSVVFIGIMTIFPQMTLFNEKTETKLDTMNLARQEMADLVAADKWKKVLVSSAVTPDTGMPDYLSDAKMAAEMAAEGYTLSSHESGFDRYQKKSDYLYEADVYLNCETYLNPAVIGEAPAAGTCAKLEPTKLHKVHLKIYDINATSPETYRLSSETFSFISYKAIEGTP